MKKYRARFDGESPYSKLPMWLTSENTICVHHTEALEGSLTEIINRIADMARTEPRTVVNGKWTIEQEQRAWTEVT